MRLKLTLYMRHGCHLCEDMQSLLNPYVADGSFELELVDIDQDEGLRMRYNTLVPVLTAGEREICHYFLDLKSLQQYMSEQGIPVK